MDNLDRSRLSSSHSSSAPPSSYSSFHTSSPYPPEPQRIVIPQEHPQEDKSDSAPVFMKGPKRKRLAKACDACHKSKRRCDGTAPCSNCYYASKACTYTDSAGRPVPAPRSFKQERETQPNQLQPGPSPSDYRSSYGSQAPYPPDSSRYAHQQSRAYPPTPTSASAPVPPEMNDDDRLGGRKRFRNDRGSAVPSEDIFLDGPIIGMTLDRPAHVELDHSLTRELTNLFFTHCHPARAVIHKPTFANALSHNRVPKHLLHAVCALAAPLSKQPRIRTSPSRYAGKPFAQEALSLMFDGAGRLVCEPDLATAQALVLLLMHDVLTKEKNVMWNTRYADLALQIIENLGVHDPDHPTLTPMPSPDFIHQSFKREAVRRIFWLIHLLDVMASIYFKKPTTFTSSDLRLRLPVDETSFELGVHSTLPEYLYLGAVRTQYASEFGHLIRVITIYARVEYALDGLNDPETHMAPQATLVEAEHALESWFDSLPDHLRFSEQSLQVQQSMFETSSNTGAWCWCCMHVYHASCGLALNLARQRSQRGPKTEPQWALNVLNLILNMLGDRAKNSVLMAAALYSFIKYCKRDDVQIRGWCGDYEEAWGTKITELAQEYRQQPSPSAQHQPTSASHQRTPTPQQQTGDPPQVQHQPQSHHHPQVSHRRLSDARHPGAINSPPTGSQPGHSLGTENSFGRRRSPSNSPGSFPLGRSDESRLHNNGLSGRSIHPLPDRDGRLGTAGLAAGSAGGIGPIVGHGGNENYGVSKEDGPGVLTGTTNGVAGNVGGFLNGGQKDGLPSLPSLKASGLLDSWNAAGSRDMKSQFHGNNGAQRTPPRRSPTIQPPPSIIVANDSDVRSTTSLGMPIGLPWLANDTR
ncbi:hypothetical protein P691DRAFT_21703 [Macrolepiota fuliginosa MF-IS2]|uniref:Zn(2)-C6 fungal-type domain-containing protein n=1 Tax=Macrolepiota fuliginosa MF-IS2 TaxID=1400762 RepID=A0A9P6C9V9_9AGAR|nr:hypothetical protein P691DRAFT_21703 [Macrolepiota fuliginosa MF-IS2]